MNSPRSSISDRVSGRLAPACRGYGDLPSPTRPLPPDPRPPASGFRASRGAAFTLIELMVAAGITTLLILGMTGIFDQSMKAWRLSSRRADAEREVRAALSTIQRDLKGLVVTTELPMYLNSLNRNQTGWKVSTGLLPPVTDTIFASSRFFFLSTQSQSAQGPNQLGDLCGIGYYLAWNNTDRAYHLYRYFRPSADQFASLSSFVTNTASLTNRTGLFPTNSADEIVAANVVNFRAEVKTVVASGIGFATNTVLTNRPSYVQLELTAYGSEAVRSFSTSNDWANPTNLLKFGRSYMWRVDL